MATVIHRYEKQIGGRRYVVESAPVGADRWRAQIARRPGMPSALMPFYGATPDAAATQLFKWLSMAHHVPPDLAE